MGCEGGIVLLDERPFFPARITILIHQVRRAQVQVTPDAGCGDPSTVTLPGDGTSLTRAGLTRNCRYTFSARAANSIGYGPFSEMVHGEREREIERERERERERESKIERDIT